MTLKHFGLLIAAIVVGTVVVKCATIDRCQQAEEEIARLERQREIAVAMLDFDKSKEAYDQIEYWNQQSIDACR